MARDARDQRALARRQLDGEVADTARGAGDQHALTEEHAAEPQGAQRGQPGYWQSGGLTEGDALWQHGQARGRHGDALGPAGLVNQPHDAAADGRAGAVGGGLDDRAGDVLARPPAGRPGRQQAQLAAIDRHRPDADDGLIAGGDRLLDFS
jgi:hypothetical protein